MIDEKFKEVMQSNNGSAVVMAGSSSDKEHIENVVKSLAKYEVPYQVRICSAHKQPEKLIEIINEYNKVRGLVAYVAIAGGTDVLSGTLSFHAEGPVISCPPDATPKEPNMSCLTNPPGSSNAYIANPKNVGKFIAQMYAEVNPRFRKLLQDGNAKKIQSLEQADIEFQKKYRGVD